MLSQITLRYLSILLFVSPFESPPLINWFLLLLLRLTVISDFGLSIGLLLSVLRYPRRPFRSTYHSATVLWSKVTVEQRGWVRVRMLIWCPTAFFWKDKGNEQSCPLFGPLRWPGLSLFLFCFSLQSLHILFISSLASSRTICVSIRTWTISIAFVSIYVPLIHQYSWILIRFPCHEPSCHSQRSSSSSSAWRRRQRPRPTLHSALPILWAGTISSREAGVGIGRQSYSFPIWLFSLVSLLPTFSRSFIHQEGTAIRRWWCAYIVFWWIPVDPRTFLSSLR